MAASGEKTWPRMGRNRWPLTVARHWTLVSAREATEAEAALLWPRLDTAYAGYEHYRNVSPRQPTVVILEPRNP